MSAKLLQPPDWTSPSGYANGVVAEGRVVFVGGQIGWDEQQRIVGDDFVAQVRQALRNIVAVLAQAGAAPQHVVRLTWFIVDKQEYLASLDALGRAYREVMGRHYPAMSVVQVAALIEDRARVEIEATAVLPRDT